MSPQFNPNNPAYAGWTAQDLQPSDISQYAGGQPSQLQIPSQQIQSGQSQGVSNQQNIGSNLSYGQQQGYGQQASQSTGSSVSGSAVLPQMQNIYNQLLGLNEGRYQNILGAYQTGSNMLGGLQSIYGGYQGLGNQVSNMLGMGQVLGQNGNWGIATPAAQAIARTAAQQQGGLTQQMTDAGLGNTTLKGNALNQLAMYTGQAYGNLGSQLAQTAAGYASQIGESGLGARMTGLQAGLGLQENMGSVLSGFGGFVNNAGQLIGNFGSSNQQSTSGGFNANSGFNYGRGFNYGTGQSANTSSNFGTGQGGYSIPTPGTPGGNIPGGGPGGMTSLPPYGGGGMPGGNVGYPGGGGGLTSAGSGVNYGGGYGGGGLPPGGGDFGGGPAGFGGGVMGGFGPVYGAGMGPGLNGGYSNTQLPNPGYYQGNPNYQNPDPNNPFGNNGTVPVMGPPTDGEGGPVVGPPFNGIPNSAPGIGGGQLSGSPWDFYNPQTGRMEQNMNPTGGPAGVYYNPATHGFRNTLV